MSWQKELGNALKNSKAISKFFNEPFPETPYPVLVPLHIANKILKLGIHSPLAKMFLPHNHENNSQGFVDPIGDQKYNKEKQIIHRYRNRILFLPTSRCPIICRYCFRKNELYQNEDLFKSEFQKSLHYIEAHSEINEIIFSGGDPLILSDSKLEYYLREFSKIEHIKYIRFHTKAPLVLPSRINDSLVELLKKYQRHFITLNISLHICHLQEIDSEVKAAIKKLSSFSLLAQIVLLKGINNNATTLIELCKKLMEYNIRPYYLHHPDFVKGGSHFTLTLEEGRTLYSLLRNDLPGWAIPQYVIDIPHGEGKQLAFNPETFDYSGLLINKMGKPVPITLTNPPLSD